MNVTIVIPVFNVAPYIEDCLRSVMRQTYTGSIECLLVDDCGTDDSINIAERIIAEYDGTIQFRILHHEGNRGLSAARNTGTLQATGDYLYYLDSDDEITEDCIDTLMKTVTEHPGVEMVQGNACRHYAQKEPIILVKKITVPLAGTNDEVRRCYYQLGQFYVNMWNKLLRRELIIKNSILCKEGLLFEDNLWIFYLLKYLNKASFVLDITYHQKKRLGSITSNADKRTIGLCYSVIYREILENLTPGYERQEYTCYANRVGMAYIKYAHDAPEFRETFFLCKEKCRQNGSNSLRFRLYFSSILGLFRFGWPIWLLLAQIKKCIKRFVGGFMRQLSRATCGL